MTPTVKLSDAARARVDAHLDAVDRVLAGQGMPLSQRRNITDDLEAQILDMLAGGAGTTPTLPDVEPVLAKLDPPEAYAQARAGEASRQQAPPAAVPTAESLTGSGTPMQVPQGPSRFSRTAIVGALWAPLFLLGPAIWWHMMSAKPPAPGPQPQPTVLEYVAMVAGIALLAVGAMATFGTTILGLVSISQIRRSAGRLYGLGLAVFDALLFPLLILDGLIFAGCAFFAYACLAEQPSRHAEPSSATALVTLAYFVALLLSILADWLIARAVWRALSRVRADLSGAP